MKGPLHQYSIPVLDDRVNVSQKRLEVERSATSGTACEARPSVNVHLSLCRGQARLQVTTRPSATTSANERSILNHSGLLLSQADEMPFDEQKFYYHDFENLPTITEEDEGEEPPPEPENELGRSITPNSPPILSADDEYRLSSFEIVQTTPRYAHDTKAASTNGEQSQATERPSGTKSFFSVAHSGIWVRPRQNPKLPSRSSVHDGNDHESQRHVEWRRLFCMRSKSHSRQGSRDL